MKAGLKSGSKISFDQFYTIQIGEAALKLGISYKFLGGTKCTLSLQRKSNEKTITVHFILTLSTISIVLPQYPEDMFRDGVTKHELLVIARSVRNYKG